MKNYEIRVFPKFADDGSVYWTACYPSVPGCLGGGDTIEEAIRDAQANLQVYLEFLQEEKRKVPEEDYKGDFRGNHEKERNKAMTYGELEKQFEKKIKDVSHIEDWRPCEEMFGVPTIPGAIVVWFDDKSKMIYIPPKEN